MQVEWFGQSTFRLRGADTTVVIDPIGDVSGLAAHGLTFEYPPLEGVDADVLLITHEHADHNGVETVGGEPVVLRSTAGTFDSPAGTVKGIASEHDPVAGTERGPNTIYVLELDGVRVAHLGDLGQASLRDEQVAAIGAIDGLFVPVGGGFTIGAEQAAEVVARLSPRWVVPMHYRTPRLNFLEDAEAFLKSMADVRRLDATSFDASGLDRGGNGPVVIVPAVP